MRFKGLAGLAVCTLLGGCASMSQQECLVSDWQAVGYEDGARGLSASHVSKHRRACAKHGVVPDLDAYRAGRAEGLQEFCQPQRGFDLGASGHRYGGVCPAELNEEFVAAYNAGRHLHELRTHVLGAERQIAAKRRQLRSIEEEADALEDSLVSNGASEAERKQMLTELRALSERKGELEEELIALERDHAVYEQELAAYESTLYDYS